MSPRSFVIAIDGPAGAGKGTLARKLAARFGYAYLDTGSLYRAVAHQLALAGADPEDTHAALEAARTLDLSQINDKSLRTASTGHRASLIAAQQPVREAILALQRDFAHTPPDGKPGAVLDGRDIGTVVCPDAQVRIFVTASPEVRAHRRWLEHKKSGQDVSEAQVLEEINERDRRDRERPNAPLRPARNAHLLDTSDLSIEAAFQSALAMIADT